jgi:hypothetical protein
MNDSHIEKTLTEAFLGINQYMADNGYAGAPYVTMSAGKPVNVSLPNVQFTEPADKRYFALNFLPNSPEPAGLGTYAENFWTGVLQIDIITPLGEGTGESEAKYGWICRLFSRGKTFGDVGIKKAYRAMQGAAPNMPYYRTVVRVECEAALPNSG